MTTLHDLIIVIHILSATLLFGTGLGTAFQMWMTHRSGDVRAIAEVSRNVVRADFFFTLPAVIVQPATGLALIRIDGYSLWEPWLVAAYVLYVLVGACWLPVVWIQLEARNLAAQAAAAGTALPPRYFRLLRWWFWFGWPAFSAVLGIFWLMVNKPALW
jgi:uncharacterized membrane protein